jgi:hypothetical protein
MPAYRAIYFLDARANIIQALAGHPVVDVTPDAIIAELKL